MFAGCAHRRVYAIRGVDAQKRMLRGWNGIEVHFYRSSFQKDVSRQLRLAAIRTVPQREHEGGGIGIIRLPRDGLPTCDY